MEGINHPAKRVVQCRSRQWPHTLCSGAGSKERSFLWGLCVLFFISFSCCCFGSSRSILLAYFYLNMVVNASFWKPGTWANPKTPPTTAFSDSETKSQLKTQMAVNAIVFVCLSIMYFLTSGVGSCTCTHTQKELALGALQLRRSSMCLTEVDRANLWTHHLCSSLAHCELTWKHEAVS